MLRNSDQKFPSSGERQPESYSQILADKDKSTVDALPCLDVHEQTHNHRLSDEDAQKVSQQGYRLE